MHRHAELGVAAHWAYKEGRSDVEASRERLAWLRQLLEPAEDDESERDFLERIRSEVFEDRVYVLTPHGDVIDLRPTTIGTGDVPPSVFQYVLRTQERVLLQDASTSKEFAHDEYLRRHHVRSVVCIPLLKQTRLIGMIYLENRLTSGVFTPARMALLEVLASDAAISLENARLYGELQERDLYYRLNVFDIYIPPLRQRRADIRALVLGFLREFDHTAGRGRDITSEAMDTLLHHGWPGNVREPQQRPRAGDHPVRGRGDSSRGSGATVGIAGAGQQHRPRSPRAPHH